MEENFKKSPNRKYSAKHILKISLEIKKLKEEFNKQLQILGDGKVNETSIESVREKFHRLFISVDSILTSKILAITKPGDTTLEHLGDLSDIEGESSEDEEFHFKMPIDKFKAFKYVPELGADGKKLSSF